MSDRSIGDSSLSLGFAIHPANECAPGRVGSPRRVLSEMFGKLSEPTPSDLRLCGWRELLLP